MAEAHATSSPHIPFQAAAAPGGFRAAWTVAGRELAEQLTSLRFLIIGLLVLGLTPLAIYVGARDYTNRLEDYNRLMAQRQAIRAGRAGRRVRGFDEPWTSENELMVLRVLRPPEVLSVLVRGLDGTMPGYWDFSPYGIETGPAALPSQWLGDILNEKRERSTTPTASMRRAPAFRAIALDGQQFDSTVLRGKVAVLNFWFMGCAPCRVEIPGLNKLADEFTGEDVVFIAFALDDEKALRNFLKETTFKYHIVPRAGEIAEQFDISVFPTHIIIDKQGRIYAFLTGGNANRHEDLRPLIKHALKD